MIAQRRLFIRPFFGAIALTLILALLVGYGFAAHR